MTGAPGGGNQRTRKPFLFVPGELYQINFLDFSGEYSLVGIVTHTSQVFVYTQNPTPLTATEHISYKNGTVMLSSIVGIERLE
jgi:hypothetical protein